MSQHSWYDKKRRHYGPKPNTRRARGLRKRDYGIKQGPRRNTTFDSLPATTADVHVEAVEIPKRWSTLKRLILIYNWYVEHYDLYHDRTIAIESAMEQFGAQKRTVEKAIKVCKYILATTPR